MKRLIAASALVLTALLLVCSESAISAAQNALLLWWNAALPALFPFFVCIGLLQSSGLLHAFRNEKYARLSCFLFGALAGYPSGARMCSLYRNTSLAVYVNLCSPMFLLGTLASGMFGNRAFFFPVAIGHYGSALLGMFFERVVRRDRLPTAPLKTSAEADKPLNEWISEGMQAMLRIGGCIVFFYVLAEVLRSIGLFTLIAKLPACFGVHESVTDAVLTGLLEFTGGCARLAAAKESFRISTALTAFLVSFGGLSVFLQAKLFLPELRASQYLPRKLFLGLTAALIAYLVAPLFPGNSAEAMSDGLLNTIAVNAMSGAGMLLSSCVSMTFAAILSIIIKKTRHSMPRPKKAMRIGQ